jgi:hypothetical protein
VNGALVQSQCLRPTIFEGAIRAQFETVKAAVPKIYRKYEVIGAQTFKVFAEHTHLLLE